DEGRGISPAFLPHVFEAFRQEDGSLAREQAGLGLGLAIVKQIVELHGGTVHAESLGEGLGAIFTLAFPLTEAAPTDAPDRSSIDAGTARDLAGLSVLVVDDDALVRPALAALLAQHGAKVTAAASAHEAVGTLEQARFDVILCDIAMPG